nr:metal-dependent transcriptional regulator [Flavobacterium sp.]
DKLDFSWDEVHDIAEQLEHIKSEQLINRLDDFLGNPTEDPHGDPIPDANGQIVKTEKQLLSELLENQNGICVGVKDTSSEFLKYLDKQGISLGSKIEIMGKESFDLSLKIRLNSRELTISNKIASNLFVKLV